MCNDNIFTVLFFGSECVFPHGESSALSFGEACGQSGIFMVWESRGRVGSSFALFCYRKVSKSLTPQNLKLVLSKTDSIRIFTYFFSFNKRNEVNLYSSVVNVMGYMPGCICYGVRVGCTHIRAFTHMHFGNGNKTTIFFFRLNTEQLGSSFFINQPASTGSSTFRYLS